MCTYVVWKFNIISIKKITSTILSITSKGTSSNDLLLKAAWYGTSNDV